MSISDVARHSGVAVSTVSYVFNGKRPISDETRARVIETAKKLGYIPKNRLVAARLGLLDATERPMTKVIALSSPVHRYTDYTNYAVFFFALAQRARRYGYDILLLMHESGDEEMYRVVNNNMVDGILLLDVLLSDSRADIAKNLPVPVVAVGYPNNTENIWSVDLDFEKIGRESVAKVHELGHSHVLILGGVDTAFEDGSNYLVRYKDAAVKRGTDLGMDVHFQGLSGYSQADIESSLDAGLRQDPQTTAIFWQGSTAGAGMLMDILHKRGIRVPQDMSVISACTHGASRLPHPIDEFPMDPATACKRGVDVLMEILEGKRSDTGAVELLPGEYIPMGTLGPVPVPEPVSARERQ
ncbi:LacI family DNA-binding transcriptional regulator [Alloscardovia omnicolens]|uniref:LacI family DNA-binding transcriptional regulator n=1 Tax=Alloscardovia omnicolens TaxID=419015 RepID=UPI003A6A089B